MYKTCLYTCVENKVVTKYPMHIHIRAPFTNGAAKCCADTDTVTVSTHSRRFIGVPELILNRSKASVIFTLLELDMHFLLALIF